MAEELKGLLEKIKREGFDAAEERGRAIEAEAARRAEETIRNAEQSAARIIAEANSKMAAAEEGGRQSLKQAARDVLISLRQEITAMLGKVIAANVRKGLNAEDLAKMIPAMVKSGPRAEKDSVIISLNKEDLDKIEKAFFAQLGEEAKKKITLKYAADIKSGFTISYDSGRSYYDFTDLALAEYIAAHLKPQLAKMLEEAAGA
jgi:V/A-type H+-transporting ATPase subunit E